MVSRGVYQFLVECILLFCILSFTRVMRKKAQNRFFDLSQFCKKEMENFDGTLDCLLLNFWTMYGSQIMVENFFAKNTNSNLVGHVKILPKLPTLASFCLSLKSCNEISLQIMIIMLMWLSPFFNYRFPFPIVGYPLFYKHLLF